MPEQRHVSAAIGAHYSPVAGPDIGYGACTVFSVRQRLGLFLAFTLLVVLRLPHAWAHGRFQGEEVTVFFAYAWHYPWYDALFRSFAGYLNLGATATTVVAVQLVKHGIVPLERIPYFTMVAALAVQSLPAVLILTGSARWLANRLAVIAALLIIAIAPATEEVFYNVLHIQFHLALCVGLILALNLPERRSARGGYGALLFFAPLCGPGAILLLPLFALRAVVDRDGRRWMQFIILAAGAAIQLLLFYGHSPARAHVLGAGTTAAVMFLRLVALPFVGVPFAYRSANMIYDSQVAGGFGWLWFAAATVLLAITMMIVATRRRDGAVWLLLGSLTIAAASFDFGMISATPVAPFDIYSAERYNFLPNVLLGLALVALAVRPGSRGRPVFAALSGLIIFIGALNYLKPLHTFADGPSWVAEVSAWHRDHRHPMAAWPRPWTADLSDQSHPCHPSAQNRGNASDPGYCEIGWLSDVYSRH